MRLLVCIFAVGLFIQPNLARGEAPPPYLGTWGGTYGAGNEQFANPLGVATDPNGLVYVADGLNMRVQVFTGTGEFVRTWGSFGLAPGQLNYPGPIAVDANENVYVLDGYPSSRVHKFSSTGTFITRWGGPSVFSAPSGLASDRNGYVYVADPPTATVFKFTESGSLVTQWSTSAPGDAYGSAPYGLAADGNGHIYVLDSNTDISGLANDTVKKFTDTGTFVMRWGGPGSAPGQFSIPLYLAVDAVGDVYVSDFGNNRVQEFASDGTFLVEWGTSGTAGGQFNRPVGIAVDPTQNVFVVDEYNYRVEKFGNGSVPAHRDSWGKIKALYH